MSTLCRKFNAIAPDAAANKNYPPPYSIRFTFEERARLDAQRGRMPLSAYIREKLFGDDVSPRKKRTNRPLADAEALGRVLGALGGSRLSANLNQLAKAVHTGSLPVTPETEAELQEACRAVRAMSDELQRALGKKPGGGL